MIFLRMLSRFSRILSGFAVIAGALILGGCASQPLPGYQVSLGNQTSLAHLAKNAKYCVINGGAPADVETTIRVVRATSPSNGSWSSYLDQALRTELTSSGNYDPASQASVEATLTELHLSDGRARLSAHFVVKRNGSVTYDKVLAVATEWDSSFAAALAVPMGFDQSAAAFQKLLRQFFDDPDFQKSA